MREHTMNIAISAEDFNKFMDWMDSIKDNNVDGLENKIEKKEVDENTKKIFEEKFEKHEEIRDSFENVCASIVSIATITNIPLDVVAELFTDKIKETVNGAECQEMVEVLRDLFY